VTQEDSHAILIGKLKPWVSTFSEAIKLQYKHGDEICIGGEIKSIFNLAKIMEDSERMCQVEVDDAVGIMTLFIPGELYNELEDKYHLKTGDEILATGKVYDPQGKLSDKNSTPSVVCWKLELLSSKK
jgi:hypothetical protein